MASESESDGVATGPGDMPDLFVGRRPSAPDAAPSVRLLLENDQPADADTLGFGPYVEGLSRFLLAPQTVPPLTVSIEGSWGSGKTSFMRQLERRLHADGNVLTVRFNAWRHDRAESLWASFLLAVIERLSRELPFLPRVLAGVKLRWFRARRGGAETTLQALTGALRVLCVALAVGSIVFALFWGLWRYGATLATAALGTGAIGGTAGAILKWAGVPPAALAVFQLVYSSVRRPELPGLLRAAGDPDYTSRVAFIENVHADFGDVMRAYAKGRPVFVFVDDIDRCTPDHAAELMKALNLLVSTDERIVFLLAMDREWVAAALGSKQRDVLPFLDGRRAVGGSHPVLSLGHAFLEKLVQLEFRLPDAGDRAIRSAVGRSDADPTSKPQEVADERARRLLDLGVDRDSPVVEQAARLVAGALDHNPRRLKKFVSAFRLRAYIAAHTGLLDQVDGRASLTLGQLAKLVAIQVRWPAFLLDWSNEPDLAEALERLDDEQGAEFDEWRGDPSVYLTEKMLKRWSGNRALGSLLGDRGETSENAMLSAVRPSTALRIMPAVSRAASQLADDARDDADTSARAGSKRAGDPLGPPA